MKQMFNKPVFETIRFARDVITASASCGCNIGGVDIGGCDEFTCVGPNAGCSCTNNTDPAQGNC